MAFDPLAKLRTAFTEAGQYAHGRESWSYRDTFRDAKKFLGDHEKLDKNLRKMKRHAQKEPPKIPKDMKKIRKALRQETKDLVDFFKALVIMTHNQMHTRKELVEALDAIRKAFPENAEAEKFLIEAKQAHEHLQAMYNSYGNQVAEVARE